MEWECAGINHLAWFTTLKHKGADLYETVLRKKFAEEVALGHREAAEGKAIFDAQNIKWGEKQPQPYETADLIRKDMCLHFGAFITESSGHLSEYLPYYRKSKAGQALLRRGYEGGSRFYATNWPTWRAGAESHRAKLASGEESVKLERSWEYASWIIEAREKDVPFRIHGNVMNHAAAPGRRNAGEAGKLITNLPGDGAVEVACMVDRNGVHPTRYGALPPQMAAVCVSNMSYFDLAAKACVEKSKEAAFHALLLDPLTAAVCTPAEIKAMTTELFDAERDFLPGYR
jgi:alpha-galactosidase